MTEKTQNLIRFIKRERCDEDNTLIDTAIRFMMRYSGCDRDVYNGGIINDIIFEAFADFMGSVNNPKFQLYMLKDIMNIHREDVTYSVYEAMLSTMQLCQVRDDTGYINGFEVKYFG